MSQKKIQLSRKLINEAMQSSIVQKRLQDKAARVLPRAKAIALSDGQPALARALEISQAIRSGAKSPSGLQRPYARVGALITAEVKKDGYGKLSRQQIMRRASNG